jgi:hypothetical protein
VRRLKPKTTDSRQRSPTKLIERCVATDWAYRGTSTLPPPP